MTAELLRCLWNLGIHDAEVLDSGRPGLKRARPDLRRVPVQRIEALPDIDAVLPGPIGAEAAPSP